MASSQPPAIITSKSTNTPGQSSPAQSQAGSLASGDTHGQRRGGGSGSFGAGATSRATPSPRNNQASRKQHKGTKRYNRLGDEDAFAESAAMQSLNSRKGRTSITHLMNFSLPPRPQQQQHGYRHGRNARRTPAWGPGSGYHAADKARYVHANYRFIVDPRANYHEQSFDADVHLDWSNVLQILVSSQSQSASCPICLGAPVSPRMAKCGHIFCLPCLIRYMHSEDETNHHPEKRSRWKKCPICWDSIYISETRPVRWYTGQEGEPPREGGDVVLRLVMRSADSTLALPRDGANVLAKDEDIPWYLAAEVMDYARVMKGSEDYMVEQFDKDIADLEMQEKEDELMFGGDSAEWTHKAIRSIKEAKEKVKDIGNPPAIPSKPVEQKLKRPPIVFTAAEDVPEMYNIQHAARSGQSASEVSTPFTQESTADVSTVPSSTPSITAASRKMSISSSESKPPAPDALSASLHQYKNRQQQAYQQPPSEYYFYQALLHYYLSPLDIRILREAFGNFASFPATILPRVERVSTGHIVDDELRKRTKYLSHLPYGCEVGFLECDWTDTVAPEVLEKFKPEIERRRKRNHDKETREEKARIKAEKEEDDKRYASARRRRSITSSDRFSANDFQPLVSAEVAEGAVSVDEDSTSTSPPWGSRRQGSSFSTLASISTSPSASRTVWGTAAIIPTSPTLQAAPRDHDQVDDGWLQGWERDLMHDEDSVLAQAQALSLSGTIGESSKAGAVSGGKKKKAKKITLMSTNVRRGA